MEDSLSGLLKQTGGIALTGLGNILTGSQPTQQPADVRDAANKGKWDWRMIGVIGAVVVGLVLLFKFRK